MAVHDTLRPGLELSPYGQAVGQDPREMELDALAAVGHSATPLLSVIRAKCLDCCCHQVNEIRLCTATACALWPFRMGTNPFRKPVERTDEQRQVMADRMRALRQNSLAAPAGCTGSAG